MPLPTKLSDLSTTASSNSPADGDNASGLVDDYFRAYATVIRAPQSYRSGVASASTVDLSTYVEGYIQITGTTTITSLGTESAGIEKVLVFSGALTLTHSANLIMPGAASVTTAAGEVYGFRSEGSGVWRCIFASRAFLASGSVSTSALVDGSVTSAKLASGAAAGNLGAGSVTSSMLASGAAAGNLGAGSVSSSMLASGAAVANLGYTPVQQGGGSNQGTSKVYIGWGSSDLLVQVDSTDFGRNWPIYSRNGAKAWVNFNGSNGSVRDQFNVSSVTRFAAGSYTVNFTNALANNNYAVNGTHSYFDSYRGGMIAVTDFSGGSTTNTAPEGATKLTTSCRVYSIASLAGTAPVDANSVYVSFQAN